MQSQEQRQHAGATAAVPVARSVEGDGLKTGRGQCGAESPHLSAAPGPAVHQQNRAADPPGVEGHTVLADLPHALSCTAEPRCLSIRSAVTLGREE